MLAKGQSHAPPAGTSALANRLKAALIAEPLEDSVSHPCEAVIAEALADSAAAASDWLSELILGDAEPALAADALLCAARLPDLGGENWRASLVSGGLASDSVEVRDAAAQAAELWGEPRMLAALTAHEEPIAWISAYIQSVVKEGEKGLSCNEREA